MYRRRAGGRVGRSYGRVRCPSRSGITGPAHLETEPAPSLHFIFCFRNLFQRIFHQAVEGAHAVFPADFFPFLIGAAAIANAYFVNAQLSTGNFYRDLRLEAEPVFFDRDRLDNFAAEGFVARLHVGEVDVGQGIG